MPPAGGRLGVGVGGGVGGGVGVGVAGGGEGEWGEPAVGWPQAATDAARITIAAIRLTTAVESSVPACRIARLAPFVPGRRWFARGGTCGRSPVRKHPP